MEALAGGDFQTAASSSVDEQWVLVALIEGMPIDEAAAADQRVWQQVGVNFWETFATSLPAFLGAGPGALTVGPSRRFTVNGVEFASVEVRTPSDPTPRHFILQWRDGWRIDVLATFAPALAGKMAPLADQLRVHPDGAGFLAVAKGQRASLEAVLQDPEVVPQLRQAVTAALIALSR